MIYDDLWQHLTIYQIIFYWFSYTEDKQINNQDKQIKIQSADD